MYEVCNKITNSLIQAKLKQQRQELTSQQKRFCSLISAFFANTPASLALLSLFVSQKANDPLKVSQQLFMPPRGEKLL